MILDQSVLYAIIADQVESAAIFFLPTLSKLSHFLSAHSVETRQHTNECVSVPPFFLVPSHKMSLFSDQVEIESDKDNNNNNNNRVVVGATSRSSSSSLTNNKNNEILGDNLVHPRNGSVCTATMIGLQRVTRSVTSSSSTSSTTTIHKNKSMTIVPMKEGFILGRSSHKIPSTITNNDEKALRLSSSSSVRPDLGMTTIKSGSSLPSRTTKQKSLSAPDFCLLLESRSNLFSNQLQ